METGDLPIAIAVLAKSPNKPGVDETGVIDLFALADKVDVGTNLFELSR